MITVPIGAFDLTIDPKAISSPAPFRWAPFRWNVKHLAILIAVVAFSFRVIGVTGTVVVLAFCSPALVMRRRPLLDILYWVFTCYPFVVLLSLYLTWITAWFAIGHLPRLNFNEPKINGLMGIPYKLTGALLVGIPFAFLMSLVFMLARVLERSQIEMRRVARYSTLFITPMTWSVAIGLLALDPFMVLGWFMD